MTLKGDFLGVEDFSGAVKVPWEWIEKGLKDEEVETVNAQLFQVNITASLTKSISSLLNF